LPLPRGGSSRRLVVAAVATLLVAISFVFVAAPVLLGTMSSQPSPYASALSACIKSTESGGYFNSTESASICQQTVGKMNLSHAIPYTFTADSLAVITIMTLAVAMAVTCFQWWHSR
jgi:hypothetical protein